MKQHSIVHKLNTKLDRIEQRSREAPEATFNNLGHALDLDLLRACFHSLDAKKAVGMDGITKKQYGNELETNLQGLLKRIRNGSYYPKPSRIVEIPKVDGSMRPLAISCIEDKIVQEAVRCILERIYEPHFLDCSFGFRPNRNAHQALANLDKRLLQERCQAVVDIDLRKYFNTIPHKHFGKILQKKVKDRRLLYLIIKLLKAPTIDKDGNIQRNEVGSPQGSILSPLIANIYLHYVLDEWFMHINQEKYRGTAHSVRYADDVLFSFDGMKEAEVFHKELIERLEAFGLSVNESKTKILPCGSRVARDYEKRGKKMPTFAFLGFLHIWGKSKNRKRNETFWRMKRRTDPLRYRKKLAELKRYLIKYRHNKGLIPYTISVIKGYMNYFAVNDNIYRIRSFLVIVKRLLFRALNRRSQKKSYNWERFQKVLDLNGYPQPSILVNLFFASKSYSMK
ncbi:MAG: group II intron reverse transcriptase/maturase [Simkania sp.]|nr:group II intron reverse transcriptase/maturase [Simkania sp.]